MGLLMSLISELRLVLLAGALHVCLLSSDWVDISKISRYIADIGIIGIVSAL
jgi:hypothetical protein